MSGSRAETGATGIQAVVGVGRGGSVGDADGIPEGGKYGGEGGDGQDGDGDLQLTRWEYTLAKKY